MPSSAETEILIFVSNVCAFPPFSNFSSSYVAAAGVPVARLDHAEIMCWYACECRYTMNRVVKQLEVVLGPDTGALLMRFGLHSGPVTAGVLRGDKCRFQLFGDTGKP